MKEIHKFIQEKLIINKDTETRYNIDDFNNDEITLYNSSDWEDDEDGANEYEFVINQIGDAFEKNKAFGALAIYGYNLSYMQEKNRSIDTQRVEIGEDGGDLVDKLITWRDLGYIIRLYHGHIELDCVNSGSRATWYIYGLSEDAYTHVDNYFHGEDYVKNLDFLYKPEMVVEITID